MRKITLSLLLLLFVFLKNEANAQIAFSNTYGGNLNEDGRWMEQMPDSGFILTGGTVTYSNGQTDMWLVRTDKYGNVMWTKSIGGTAFDFANMVKPVTGGFVLCGVTNRNGNDDAIILKTDNNGNTLWTTVEGDSGIQWFEGLIPTRDGGYAAVGVNTGAGSHGFYDAWLVKFNGNGVRQWAKNIGGQSYEIGNSIQETPDGGFIIGGQTYSYGSLDGDFYMVKTDSAGNTQWQQTYAQPHLQECHYARCTPDGGYIMVGDADTLPNGLGDTDIWLIKTDSAGNVVWDHVFGGTKKDGGKTVEVTSDGGFVIAGITRSFGLINPNYYLIKTDPSGILEWQVSSYGTTYHDHAYRGIETSDFGFAEFGFFRNSSGAMDFALVKLGPNGGITKDISVESIDAPLTNICRSSNVPLSVTLTNYGATNEQNIPVTIEVNNGNGVTFLTDTFIGSLTPNMSTTLTFSTTYDFAVDGAYNLKAYTNHRNGDISYINDSAYLAVNVLSPVGDPVTTSAISCVNAALTLTATPGSAADSMFWFDDNVNGKLLATGNSYTTPTLSSTTTYYVQSKKGKGSMVGPVDNSIGTGSTSNGGYLKFDARKEFTLVSVKVFPIAAGNRTIELRNSAGQVLQSKTVSLPAAPGGMRVYLNFTVPEGNDLQLGLGNGSVNLFRNSAGAIFPYSVSQTVEIFGTNSSNVGTYYYFYDWYVFVQSQNCASNLIPAEGIITTTATTALDRARCGPGTVTLSANPNFPVDWYDAPSGGAQVASGNSFTTPFLNSTTTYYLENSGCPNRIAVDAIINTYSTAPAASDVIHCGPGNVTLNATATDPVYWYSAAVNGVLLFSGNQYVTPYLNATTTYYAVAGSDCPSSPLAVNAIIDAANPPAVTGASACGPASVTLNASSPDPVRWYTVPTGGVPVSTSYTYNTPILASSKTYYVEAGQVCSSVRVPVLANIIVADPPVGTNGSRCGSGTVVISAQSANTITWWSAATGGNQLGSGGTFTTPSINATTTYYAQATNGACTSSRTAVTASVNITQPPAGTSAARCGPGTVTLNATSADTVYWYTASSGGLPLSNGTSFTTPSLNTTTTYYAQASLSCPSVRVPVTATISSQAAAPVTTGAARCGSGTVILNATSPDPITWYDAAAGGNVVGTGSSWTTPSLTSTTTYYAIAGITGCLSNAVSATATINPVPVAPTVTGDNNCGPDTLTLSASAGDPMTWYTASTGGNVVTTGTAYTHFFTSTTTFYVEANDGTCSSTRTAVTATIYNNPTINLGPPAISINQGQSIVLDAGAGFTTYDWSTGATTHSITVTLDGTYYVYVTDAHGCHGSDTIVVNVIPNGIETNELDNAIELYPNPTNGELNVMVNYTKRFDIIITDIVGQVLITDTHRNNSVFNKTYDLTAFSKGMYFLRLNSEGGSTTRSIIIQ